MLQGTLGPDSDGEAAIIQSALYLYKGQRGSGHDRVSVLLRTLKAKHPQASGCCGPQGGAPRPDTAGPALF